MFLDHLNLSIPHLVCFSQCRTIGLQQVQSRVPCSHVRVEERRREWFQSYDLALSEVLLRFRHTTPGATTRPRIQREMRIEFGIENLGCSCGRVVFCLAFALAIFSNASIQFVWGGCGILSHYTCYHFKSFRCNSADVPGGARKLTHPRQYV